MSRLASWPARALAGASVLGVAATIASALVGGKTLHPTALTPLIEGNAAAARPATSVEVISCSALPHVPGKSITTAVVTFPPGAYSPRHRHPGSVTAYVLKGTIRSQLAGDAPRVFAAGQSWFEPPGAVHLFPDNPNDRETAQLLAVYVANDGCGPLVIPEQP
jgi:quercetin dioxygenase-like cupin family protein